MEPRFRKRADGSLNLTDTVEAAKVKEANKGKLYTRHKTPVPGGSAGQGQEKLKSAPQRSS